jgi:uncharacterized membrane protein YidH (DUF202 family)
MDQELSCGPAQPMELRAWQRGAVALQVYGVGTWQANCSFIRLWYGEVFHDLRVQSAVILVLSIALPQSSENYKSWKKNLVKDTRRWKKLPFS